jgi:hypothetical protein
MIIFLACAAVAVLAVLIWRDGRAAWREPCDLEAVIRQALLDDLDDIARQSDMRDWQDQSEADHYRSSAEDRP